MKNILILFAILICFSCNNAAKKNAVNKDSAITTAKPAPVVKASTFIPVDKSKILGTWTDGSSENATFDVGKDSILYVDQLKSYKYTLIKDSITIHYDDYIYHAKIYFIKDTLVMDSKEYDVAKFWKFKN